MRLHLLLPLLAALLYANPVSAQGDDEVPDAPRVIPRTTLLEHPEVALEAPVVLEAWQLLLRIPAGWAIDLAEDEIELTSEDLPNTGIRIIGEETLVRDTFLEEVWAKVAAEPDLTPLSAGWARAGDLLVPVVWLEMELEDGGVIRQIMALYEFSPDEYPLLAIASAPASLWDEAGPEIEAILGSLAAAVDEESAFAAQETGH